MKLKFMILQVIRGKDHITQNRKDRKIVTLMYWVNNRNSVIINSVSSVALCDISNTILELLNERKHIPV